MRYFAGVSPMTPNLVIESGTDLGLLPAVLEEAQRRALLERLTAPEGKVVGLRVTVDYNDPARKAALESHGFSVDFVDSCDDPDCPCGLCGKVLSYSMTRTLPKEADDFLAQLDS